MSKRRVVIIGGGLAGMTVAKELLQQQVPVVILESSKRLGGKAGSDIMDGVCVDHGYHVFPGWYLNTRKLLRDLGAEGNLIDMDRFYHLLKGAYPRFIPFYEPSLRNIVRNIFSGLMPVHESVLSFYYGIDLASQPFRYRGYLDRVSSMGFYRSRFYATERTAVFHHQTLLQQSAIPDYEISAMVTQKLARAALGTLTPLFSIMNGSLQDTFIQPFERRLRELGAEIHFDRCVRRVELTEAGRVCGIECDGGGLTGVGPDDICVLATPPEVAVRLVDAQLFAAEHGRRKANPEQKMLADCVHLRTAHMAAADVYFKRRLPHIPAHHVTLYESRYGLSFIDISQHWTGLDRTVLSLISSDFESLRCLPEKDMKAHLLAELRAYVPAIRPDDVADICLQTNLTRPLFINTIGAWFFRPETCSALDNLYIAGDYCRTEADLATMEGAISSGLLTARDLLAREKLGVANGPIPLKFPPRWQLLLLKYLGLPLVAPVGAWCWLQRHAQEALRVDE